MVIGKKQIKIIIFITFIVTIGFTIFGITNKLKYAEYNEVDAKIVDIKVEINKKNSNHSVKRFIKYEYEVDGKKYISSKRISEVGIVIKNKEKLETIKYNPQNPNEIEDTYTTKTAFGVAIFFAIIGILLAITLKKQ